MSDDKIVYKRQFQVIARTTRGEVEHICFHGPGKMGFPSVEVATAAVELLAEGDGMIGRERNYEIIPVIVSEDYEKMPELEFEIDEMDQLFKDTPPEQKPSGSGLN